MKTVGVVGLGDMGSGLAKNLLKSYAVRGFDPDPKRMENFVSGGGTAVASAGEVGIGADAVFVMVMNGSQVNAVVFGERNGDGLAATMARDSVILMTATIKPSEVVAVAERLEGTGIHLVDTPVSGGFPGAQSGTLTMMAAGSERALSLAKGPMEAVSGTIHQVGTGIGQGQTVKACLQSLIGSIFSATFEASVLAAKAGVGGEVLHRVFSTSGAGCGVVNTALGNIIDRKFEGTGSHINTMYKDLTIALDLARDIGVPLFTASTAMQLFQAGRTRYPDGDNWVVTRVLEEIVGAGLER